MMDDDETKKTFNHAKGSVADRIRLIGELEHARAHALRAAVSALQEEENDDSDSTRYLILAKRAQELRREYMRKYFGELKDTDWCLCKSAACLRQLTYEVCEGDAVELRELDDFVDEIWGEALGIDLSDCVSCAEDRQSGQVPSAES